MSAPGRQLFARLAIAALVLTFIVVVASAFMRHTLAGIGCTDWPACYGRVTADTQTATSSIGVHIARVLHRLAASAALLVIVGLLIIDRRDAYLRRARALAAAALAIALALAALGIVTPGASLPAVPLGNLLGGFLMLAVLASLVGSVPEGPGADEQPSRTRQRAFALVLLAALFVQAFVGGLIGTQFALPSCPALDRCVPYGDVLAASNPFRAPVVAGGRIVPPDGAGGLHGLHRALGAAIAVAALGLAFAIRRSSQGTAALLAALVLAGPLLGAAAIVAMPALAITVLHNAVAAAIVIVVAYWITRSGAGRDAIRSMAA